VFANPFPVEAQGRAELPGFEARGPAFLLVVQGFPKKPVHERTQVRGKIPGEIGGRGETHFLVGRVQGNPGVSFPVFGAPGGSIIDPGLHPQVFHANPADLSPGGKARYGNPPRGGKVQGALDGLEAPGPIPEGFRGKLDASFHVAAGNARSPKKGDEKSRDVGGVSPAV